MWRYFSYVAPSVGRAINLSMKQKVFCTRHRSADSTQLLPWQLRPVFVAVADAGLSLQHVADRRVTSLKCSTTPLLASENLVTQSMLKSKIWLNALRLES